MELTATHITNEEQLAYLFQKLVEVIRYENEYAFAFLKQVTLNKEAVIELDGTRLLLSATNENGYTLTINEPHTDAEVNLKTEAIVLRQIAAGLMTIDKAIADNKVYICGEFNDTLCVYKLAILLMREGALLHPLRMLWAEFLSTWEGNQTPMPFGSFEDQKANYGSYIQSIPREILEVGLE